MCHDKRKTRFRFSKNPPRRIAGMRAFVTLMIEAVVSDVSNIFTTLHAHHTLCGMSEFSVPSTFSMVERREEDSLGNIISPGMT